MRHIIRFMLDNGLIVRHAHHIFVTPDGEGWKSAFDAAVHVIRMILGA